MRSKMKSTLLAGIVAMFSAMDSSMPRYEPDPIKRKYRKGDYVPEPKRPLSKKQKRNRKLGRR